MSEHPQDPSPAEESDWIKSLVAEALIRATDDESTPVEALTIEEVPVDDAPAATEVTASHEEPRTEMLVGAAAVPAGGVASQVAAGAPVSTPRTANTTDEPARPFDQVLEEEDAKTEGFRQSDIRTIVEWLAVIISALVVALVIKAFVLQAFWIPSESMQTTVNEGDRILVNKVSYRLHDVRRGDLVVFKKLPGTPGQPRI